MNKRLLCLWLAILSLSFHAHALAATAENQSRDAPSDSDFVDVSADSPFYEAVHWASQKGITKGSDETHFNPKGKCTRAHIITFIWRYAGEPRIPGPQPYADVPSGCYYEDAAHWANNYDYEVGDTIGGQLRFMGGMDCTRLAAVIYLWKLAGRPKGFEDNAKQFLDVKDAALETRQAVGWAVEKEITNGTSKSMFSPESVCTRGHIVTFLYRYDKIA